MLQLQEQLPLLLLSLRSEGSDSYLRPGACANVPRIPGPDLVSDPELALIPDSELLPALESAPPLAPVLTPAFLFYFLLLTYGSLLIFLEIMT